MKWQDIVKHARDTIECPRCHQPPGSRCVTKTGGRVTWQHDGRTKPIRDAYFAGMEEGERNVLDTYLDAGPEARWFQRMLERRRKERADGDVEA